MKKVISALSDYKNEYKIIIIILFISLFISMIFLFYNYYNISIQKKHFNDSKNNLIKTKLLEAKETNSRLAIKYRKSIVKYNEDLNNYYKDSIDYPLKYNTYLSDQRKSDLDFKNYEIRHKRWVRSLTFEQKLKYSEIKKKKDDFLESQEAKRRSLFYKDDGKMVSKDELIHYEKSIKDNIWLEKNGEPKYFIKILYEPSKPIKPNKPNRPKIINKISVEYASYNSIYNNQLGFWDITIKRDLKYNILPVIILVFLILLVVRNVLIIPILTYKSRYAIFRKIAEFVKYIFPFKNKGSIRLIISLYVFISSLWSLIWFIIFSHNYLLIFSSFIIFPIIYIIGIWIYHGYIDSKNTSN